jgi:transcription elongation factor GreA
MQVPKRKSESNRKYAEQEDHYLTAEAVRKLERELRDIENIHRPKAVEDLTRAREMGDLSENAAYHEAKARLGRYDTRLFHLKERLKNAIVIESGGTDKVSVGSTVIVEVNGKAKTYQILGSQETDPASGRISHLSPLGSALMGKSVGDVAEVAAGERRVAYLIKEIK